MYLTFHGGWEDHHLSPGGVQEIKTHLFKVVHSLECFTKIY